MSLEPRQETRDLPCKLNAEEIRVFEQDHLRTSDEIAEALNAKKIAVKALGEQIDQLKELERKQRKAALTGEEDRPVVCIECVDLSRGLVQLYRTDTGEAVGASRAASKSELAAAKHKIAEGQQLKLYTPDDAAPEGLPTKKKDDDNNK